MLAWVLLVGYGEQWVEMEGFLVGLWPYWYKVVFLGEEWVREGINLGEEWSSLGKVCGFA